jgi:hypothetical protein
VGKGTQLGRRDDKIATFSSVGAKASALQRSAKAAKQTTDLLPRIQHYQADGATTLRQIAERLNAEGITTRGGVWSAVQVARVMKGMVTILLAPN